MSTGLTWVTIVDAASAAPDFQTSPFGFSDYSEALSFSLWLSGYMGDVLGYGTSRPRVAIYTTSPNRNGYVDSEGNFNVYG